MTKETTGTLQKGKMKGEYGEALISADEHYRKGRETGTRFVSDYHYYDHNNKEWVRLQVQDYLPDRGSSYVEFASKSLGDISEKTKLVTAGRAADSTASGLGVGALASYAGWTSIASAFSFGLLGFVAGGVYSYLKDRKSHDEYVGEVESPYGKVSSSYETADVWGRSYTELIKTADLPKDMYWAKTSEGTWSPVYMEKSFKDTNYAITGSREGLNPHEAEERKASSIKTGLLSAIGAALLTNPIAAAAIGIGAGFYRDYTKKKETELQRYELV
jgi:hypothetical protein